MGGHRRKWGLVGLATLALVVFRFVYSRRSAHRVEAPEGLTLKLPSINWPPWRKQKADHSTHIATGGHGQVHHHEHESAFETLVEDVALCPWLLFVEIGAVVVLSTIFESVEHWIRRRCATTGDRIGGRIMDVLFKEFSGLGFIGIFLFLLTQSRLFMDPAVTNKMFGDRLTPDEAREAIKESFETVHMMIFLLLVVLMFQAIAMHRVTRNVVETWGRFERTRAWGLRNDSFETLFVEGKYLERAPSSQALRNMELLYKEPFTYEAPLLQKLLLHHDTLHNLVMWRAIRHEFIFGDRGDPGESKRVPCPQQFSFEVYLRERLGQTVLSVIEVDMWIWLLTLIVLMPITFICLHLDLAGVEEVQCLMAYLLLAAGLAIGYQLEADTLNRTPTLPRDARKILRLFSGTSTQMLMKEFDRSKFERGDVDMEQKFGAPGLGGVEKEGRIELGPSPSQSSKRPDGFMTSTRYAQLFELLAFWQAISVTCLILFYLSEPLNDWKEVTFYALAWAEWPLMLFGVMPALLQRLTIRNSIGDETDEGLVRAVSLESKSILLRYHIKLVQLLSYVQRCQLLQAGDLTRQQTILFGRQASNHSEEEGHAPVGSPTSDSEKQRRRTWRRGLQRFRALPQSDQHEIEQVFESLDVNNNQEVSLKEIAANWEAMGFSNTDEAAWSLLQSIDHDGSQRLTWSKFQALAGMAAADHRPQLELQDDFRVLFGLIDLDSDSRITVFELHAWLQRINSGMSEVDVSSLLYNHFGQAKPSIAREEFVQWMSSIGSDHGVQTPGH
ncbi:unnamed protein product [Polarella glacialis]|uniref:EF-hand domain-containing protein n=1 Tax=Polarella glacialis TaxID=89957 RepID=A0A813FL63_POLGL|nr:unnamed protein product [Polarella glacialis]